MAVQAPVVAPESSPVQSAPSQRLTIQEVMDACRVYKQLLDEGIITQEEFTTKKKQLLGL